MSEGSVDISSVRGFASIDYRLSPHPQFPQDPDNTPATEFRGARHPDHLQDTRSALAFLAEHYGLTNDYTLIGHSVGATLAYQLLMGSDALMGAELQEVPLPAAIIAISGIYDMVGLVQRLGEIYNTFTTAALGTDKKTWKQLSPALYAGNYKSNWPEGRCNIIAWSRDDTLVDEPEIDAMTLKLSHDGLVTTVRKDLTKQHNVVWEEGTQVARLIADALAQLHR
jgi:kynurenine formamidase